MAALTLPTFPNPHDSKNPVRQAYAWIGELAVNFRNNTSQIVLYVHPNEPAWQDDPVGTLGMRGGDQWANDKYFPTIGEFMTDPEFAQAFGLIAAKIMAKVKDNPACAGATDYVPPPA